MGKLWVVCFFYRGQVYISQICTLLNQGPRWYNSRPSFALTPRAPTLQM